MAESFAANTESCFRSPKTGQQESKLPQGRISKSTAYKTKWAVKIFHEWPINRNVKVPVLDSDGAIKDYGDLSKVQSLSTNLVSMDANAQNTGRVNLSRRLRIVKERCIQQGPFMELPVASEGI